MSLDEYWQTVRERYEIAKDVEDFRFDAAFYLTANADVLAANLDPWEHYQNFGKTEGRISNPYSMLKEQVPDLDEALDDLSWDPGLKQLIQTEGDAAYELVFAILSLGSPVDSDYTGFSEYHYQMLYSDVAGAEVKAFHHYLTHGRHEARVLFQSVRDGLRKGDIAPDPDKPTCFICIHELSRSGAPMVGRDLAEQASKTHNVYISSLRGGELMKDVLSFCCAIFVSPNPQIDLPMMLPKAIEDAELAILNSVETWSMISPFLVADIPIATYLHEFTNYTFPPYKTIAIAAFCDLLVFSSKTVRSNWNPLLTDLSVDQSRDTFVLPQRTINYSTLSQGDYAKARAAISDLLKIDISGKRLVVGAGQVSARKGTDSFVMASQLYAHRDKNAIFVWIGSNWNHEDLTFGVWLDARLTAIKDQKSESNFHILPAGPYYLDLMKSADVFFLTSVLDPLPNVVFDAIETGCEVVYFEGVTGFDDDTYTVLPFMHPVPMGDLVQAANEIQSAPRKNFGESRKSSNLMKLTNRFRSSKTSEAPIVEVGEKEVKLTSAEIFEPIREKLLQSVSEQDSDAESISEYKTSLLFAKYPVDDPARLAERAKLAATNRSLMWRSVEDARDKTAASEHFSHHHMSFASLETAKGSPPPFHIHLHAYYTESFKSTLQNFAAFRKAASILVTTNTKVKATKLRRDAEMLGMDVEVRVTGNVGRDILPFIEAVAERPENEIWGHFHLKESRGTMDSAEAWRDFLFNTLMGDENGLTNALEKMQDPSVGLVAPFDPNIVEWRQNRRLIPEFQPYLPYKIPSELIAFPVGNMFYVRSEVVKELLNNFGKNYPWPKEPIANDGTIFHFIERIWPAAAAHLGLDSIFLDAPHLSRG